ncbi:MAG: HI0074 family nucleotidyltransferase substrate-binding subunit [Candidatus Thermoplasmatota archaeon]
MDRLKERIAFADKAVTTLESVLREPERSALWRDACIKRFEYSFETTWKAAQRYLALQGTELASPKPVIRACFQSGLLDEMEAEAALAMVEDRNLAAHTYDEKLAEVLASRLPAHAKLLRAWVDRLARTA